MISIKKNNVFSRAFVAFFTFTLLLSCGPKKYYNDKIQGKEIPVTSDYTGQQDIENYIQPYREHIDHDLDSVLAYAPETLDKSKSIAKWQTTIGNLMADVTFEKADKVFYMREKKHVDLCLLKPRGHTLCNCER